MEKGVAVVKVDLKDRALTELYETFRLPGWIDTFPLNTLTVFNYFQNTPFYDKGCNNQILAMQNMDPSKIK